MNEQDIMGNVVNFVKHCMNASDITKNSDPL